jgi:arsenate reductase-like glutaredoxin family protein
MRDSTIEESVMPGKLKIYEYSNCSSCKKALKFLDAKKAPYEKVAIVEQPPTVAELKTMLGHLGGELKKLFNTSGRKIAYDERSPSVEASRRERQTHQKTLFARGPWRSSGI